MSASNSYDMVVVGAGAAGFMGAIFAARQSPRVRILLRDSKTKLGAKILISGGTRCNVTHQRVTASDYQGGPAHFIRHVLEAFSPEQTRKFFEEIGVALTLEPSGKYFPVTHSGKTVLEALMAEAARNNVEIRAGNPVRKIEKRDALFYLDGGLCARRVLLATGGLSLPETGSDGTGFRLAESLGHTMVPTQPALSPLLSHDQEWAALSGIALPVKLSYFESGRKKAESQGAMLWTHFGFSGPAVLDISRHVARAPRMSDVRVEANFLPEISQRDAEDEIQKMNSSNKQLKNFFSERFGFPSRFSETFLTKVLQDSEISLKRLSKTARRQLLSGLFSYPLEITGVYGYRKAEATSGGIDLAQVHARSMESRRVPGLYFAGEMLDVDGRIGGFNFQWAWSSGALAGRSAARSLDP